MMLSKKSLSKIKKPLYAFLGLVLITPSISNAQSKPTSFSDLAGNAIDIFSGFIYLTMGLALFYFLFGMLRYMTHYGNENQRSESAKTMGYGLLALFIMVAIWGIIALLRSSLLGESGVGIPQFNGSGGSR